MIKRANLYAALLDKVVNIPVIQITFLVIVFLLVFQSYLSCFLKALKNIRAFIVLALMFHMFSLSAQTPRKDSGANGLLTVSGTVISASDSQPIAGVSVSISDEKGRVSTKSDGSFTIEVKAKKGKILFSHLGYNAQSLNYTAGVSIDVELIPMDNRLDETVVIGYGTTTRRFATGSVTKVTSKDIQHQPISNPMLALQGLVPGLDVTPSSGISGAGVDLKVRGISSLTQGSEPLVLLNGNPIATNGQNIAELSNATKSGLSLFNAINPADIESIEVLKDADATAIYGSRGANGVILITTKKAFAEKAQLNFSSNIGVSRAGNVIPLLDTKGYLAMRREAFDNSGLSLTEANAPDLLLADTTRYTDFSKYLVGSNNLTQDYNLGYVTGGDRTSFRLNGNLRREAFQFDRSKSSDRYNIGFNVNHRSADRRFTLDMAGNFTQTSSDLTVYDPAAYLYLMPHLQLRNDDGSLNWKIGPYSFSSLGFTNPLAQLENSFSGKFKNLFANIGLQYQLYPDLNLKVTGGYSFGNNNEKARYPSTGIDPSTSNLPFANFSNGSRYSWIVEPQLAYTKQLGLHNINFLLGSSIQQDGSENTLLAGTNYSDDNLLGTIAAAGKVVPSYTQSRYKYAALFARLGYRYNARYLLNIAARRDGSSRFGPGKQFANFYSIGAGWIFSEEKWMKQHSAWLSYGKLRGSYGITGNDQIGNYKFLDTWSSNALLYNGVVGMDPSMLYNPDYAWEANRKLELAMDMGFWKDRILLSFSFYRNRSDNQLIAYSLPFQAGFSSVNQNLDAEIENKGLEITLDANLIQGSYFSWSTKFNIARSRNKLLSFPGLENSSYANKYVIGQSIRTQKLYRYTGINAQTGLYEIEDSNGDGKYNIQDRTVLVDYSPDFFGGWSNTFSYKRWGMGFLVDFKKQRGNGAQAANPNAPGLGLVNHAKQVMDRWQQEGDVPDYQRFIASRTDKGYSAFQNFLNSDGKVTDASFVKLRNVYLSYSPDVAVLKPTTALELFCQIQNLWTYKRYKGGDPEIQNYLTTPPMRIIMFGLKISL